MQENGNIDNKLDIETLAQSIDSIKSNGEEIGNYLELMDKYFLSLDARLAKLRFIFNVEEYRKETSAISKKYEELEEISQEIHRIYNKILETKNEEYTLQNNNAEKLTDISKDLSSALDSLAILEENHKTTILQVENSLKLSESLKAVLKEAPSKVNSEVKKLKSCVKSFEEKYKDIDSVINELSKTVEAHIQIISEASRSLEQSTDNLKQYVDDTLPLSIKTELEGFLSSELVRFEKTISVVEENASISQEIHESLNNISLKIDNLSNPDDINQSVIEINKSVVELKDKEIADTTKIIARLSMQDKTAAENYTSLKQLGNILCNSLGELQYNFGDRLDVVVKSGNNIQNIAKEISDLKRQHRVLSTRLDLVFSTVKDIENNQRYIKNALGEILYKLDCGPMQNGSKNHTIFDTIIADKWRKK